MKKLFTLVFAIFIAHAVSAQIPNNDFENWTSSGSYSTPDNWGNLNPTTSAASVYTCTKGNPGYSGSSYIILTSKTVPLAGVVPGIAVSGLLNPTTFVPQSGFPFTSRPAALTGAWQYMGFSGDRPRFVVYLSKWNIGMGMRDTVAYTDTTIAGLMVMSWETFSIPVNYHSAATPDSAIIVLSSSSTTPANNSYVYVDALAFSGVEGVADVAVNSISWAVYPDPASNQTMISYNCRHAGNVKMLIADMTGKCVKGGTYYAANGENKFMVDLSGLAPGVYFIRVADGLFSDTKKLVIE